ncbi:MAG: MFS transporter [Alicyclobacillus sp.]|nr:MFS transporter [Alicyclobacillus sp.]
MRANLLRLRAFYLCTGLSGGILTPYLSLLFGHNGFSSSEIGVVMGIGTAASVLAQPLWGVFVDRSRMTRLSLILSCLVPGVAAVLYDLHWLWFVTLISIVFNMFSVPQTPIADAYAVATARENGVAYGSIRLFGSMGFSIGGYLGGLYMAHFPATTLFAPYLVFALLGAAAAITLPKDNPAIQPGVGPSISTGLRVLIRDRRFVGCVLGGFLLSQTLTAFNTYFAITFHQMGGSLNLTGVAFMLASATNVPSMILATRAMHRFGRENVLMLASLAYVVRWAVQAYIPIPAVAIAIQVLHGLSFGFYYVVAVDFISRLAQRQLQATAQSLFGMICGGLAGVVGNLLNGFLLHGPGAKVMYEVDMVSCAFGALCFLYVRRVSRRLGPPRPAESTAMPSLSR